LEVISPDTREMKIVATSPPSDLTSFTANGKSGRGVDFMDFINWGLYDAEWPSGSAPPQQTRSTGRGRASIAAGSRSPRHPYRHQRGQERSDRHQPILRRRRDIEPYRRSNDMYNDTRTSAGPLDHEPTSDFRSYQILFIVAASRSTITTRTTSPTKARLEGPRHHHQRARGQRRRRRRAGSLRQRAHLGQQPSWLLRSRAFLSTEYAWGKGALRASRRRIDNKYDPRRSINFTDEVGGPPEGPRRWAPCQNASDPPSAATAWCVYRPLLAFPIPIGSDPRTWRGASPRRATNRKETRHEQGSDGGSDPGSWRSTPAPCCSQNRSGLGVSTETDREARHRRAEHGRDGISPLELARDGGRGAGRSTGRAGPPWGCRMTDAGWRPRRSPRDSCARAVGVARLMASSTRKFTLMPTVFLVSSTASSALLECDAGGTAGQGRPPRWWWPLRAITLAGGVELGQDVVGGPFSTRFQVAMGCEPVLSTVMRWAPGVRAAGQTRPSSRRWKRRSGADVDERGQRRERMSSRQARQAAPHVTVDGLVAVGAHADLVRARLGAPSAHSHGACRRSDRGAGVDEDHTPVRYFGSDRRGRPGRVLKSTGSARNEAELLERLRGDGALGTLGAPPRGTRDRTRRPCGGLRPLG
jgi:hypothetical protein